MEQKIPILGRGAAENPPNRFELLSFEKDEEFFEEDGLPFPTEYFKEQSKSIISYNDSPDVGMSATVNPYRGCEHGCIYCYARPTHEYAGFSSGLDFESKIIVKMNAPQLLRRELSSKKWNPQVVGLSGVTDCYQPIERKLKLTRQCLEIFAEFCNPVVIITKSFLVTRDIDVLKRLAKVKGVVVIVSVTSLDPKISRIMEPRAANPQKRLAVIRELAAAGIPVGVNVAPVVPAITDMEIPAILKAAKEAGATSAGYVILRLPFAVKHLFENWLTNYFPDRKEKVLNRIKDIRDGKLNDPNFNSRMRGEGVFADQTAEVFHLWCRKLGLNRDDSQLSTDFFKRKEEQLDLFNSK